MEHDQYLSYGQAYLFSNGMIGMVSADEMAENPVTQETDALGTRVYLWERRRGSPTRDDFGSFGGMLEAYEIEETGDSEEDFYRLSMEAERRGERLYPIGIYEHSLVRYYLDSVTDRNQTIDGVAVLDKEKIRQIDVSSEEYLKSVLETLTDWTNGDVYCVDMFTPRIVLDGGEVFVKLIPDYETMDPVRELYAPKTSDLKEYLPDGINIAELIGETFYSTDQLRNFLERPENGMYREIQNIQKATEQQTEVKALEEQQEAKVPARVEQAGEKETDDILTDYAERLKRTLALPPAVSERLLVETLVLIGQDAERYGWQEMVGLIREGADGNSRETARKVLLELQEAATERGDGRSPAHEKEEYKRNGQGMDI